MVSGGRSVSQDGGQLGDVVSGGRSIPPDGRQLGTVLSLVLPGEGASLGLGCVVGPALVVRLLGVSGRG